MLSYVFSMSSMMGIAGILLLTMILLKRSYRHIRRSKRKKKKTASKTSFRSQQTMLAKSLDAPAEVAKWEVHLHEVSREIFAQLDNKMIALSHLIKQAEQQCKLLEAATLEAEQNETIGHAVISEVD